ncbi:MAG TPA: NAD(P)H-dependent oxidoreductase [Rhizomicrobium sp.]|nr:NAD(P)H-dependent oxidoreductase [Rhizomicrobium sp.]
MEKHVLVINGHPEPSPERFCNALSRAFYIGAQSSGWKVHRLEAATGCFRSGEMKSTIPVDTAAGLMHAADRLAIVYPLWFDAPPAPVQTLLEAAAKFRQTADLPKRPRSAQLVVTMELPAFIHRAMLKERDAQQVTFIGSVSALTDAQRQQWLHDIRILGAGETSKIVRFPRRPEPAVLRAA